MSRAGHWQGRLYHPWFAAKGGVAFASHCRRGCNGLIVPARKLRPGWAARQQQGLQRPDEHRPPFCFLHRLVLPEGLFRRGLGLPARL